MADHPDLRSLKSIPTTDTVRLIAELSCTCLDNDRVLQLPSRGASAQCRDEEVHRLPEGYTASESQMYMLARMGRRILGLDDDEKVRPPLSDEQRIDLGNLHAVWGRKSQKKQLAKAHAL